MNTQRPSTYRSGYVALIGPANAGKSTLLNAILGQKIAIVTPKAQTTRNRILGIKTTAEAQIVFLDTPGFVRGERPDALQQSLTSEALKAAADVDLRVLVLDASVAVKAAAYLEDVEKVFRAKKVSPPQIVLLNKVDVVEKDQLLPLIAKLDEQFGGGAELIPISATKNDGLDAVLEQIVSRLPEGPAYFTEEQLSDQSERFLVAEIVREKVFLKLQKELPYSAAVMVERWEEEGNLLRINAVIVVERASQKGIVIGKGGQMIKSIGQAARVELERIFGTKVHLELFVRVEPNWTKTAKGLRRAGVE